MHRRNMLKTFSGAGAGLLAAPGPLAQAQDTARRGLPPLKITDIKTILTQPAGDHLVIVKVLTSEPGLYGVGCATHRERSSSDCRCSRDLAGGQSSAGRGNVPVMSAGETPPPPSQRSNSSTRLSS